MAEGWDMVQATSPEGWHEVLVPVAEGGVAVYKETAELDAAGMAVFEFVGYRE